MANSDNLNSVVERKLFTEAEIADTCKRLGSELTTAYAGKRPIVVGALKGAVFFLTDLFREMDVKADLDFIDVSSYNGGTESTGKIVVEHDMSKDVKDRDVLIVEDIVDTGLTLQFMKDLLLKRGAKSVKCAVLLDKKARRTVDIEPEFVGYECPNEFVIGYGMDFDGLYRNLPYVGVLKPSEYQN